MERYNLGSGSGTSVRQLLAAAARLSGRSIPHTIDAPRPGDPAVLVADISRAQASLAWSPGASRVEDILASAWRWHCGQGSQPYSEGLIGRVG
jgi:UDP-glucose 4-epimerase